MRIVIDLQAAQSESRFRGIGRYALSLTKALVQNRANHEIIIALSGLFPGTIAAVRAEFEGLLQQEDIVVWYAPDGVDYTTGNTQRTRVAELIREFFLVSLAPDVILTMSTVDGVDSQLVYSVKRFSADQYPLDVAIVYDFIPFFRGEVYRGKNLIAKKEARNWYDGKLQALGRADALLAISDSTAREAVEVLGIETAKVTTIFAAVDEHFSKPPEQERDEQERLLQKVGITKPFIAHAGSLEPRKNFEGLIEAFSLLPDEVIKSLQLVLITDEGKRQGTISKAIKDFGLSAENVIITGYLSDDQLKVLYSNCRVFVYPSLHEGFGLPALEAMMCGAVVIGSKTSSIPEVIGLEAALFDPQNVQAIAEKMLQAISDEKFRQELRDHARTQVGEFSWNASAKRAITNFEERLANRSARERSEPTQGELIQRIAALKERGKLTDVDLLHTSRAIATNAGSLKRFHERNQSRPAATIYVDISELVRRDAKTGVQRVVRSVLAHLLKCAVEGFTLEPAYLGAEGRYRYARRFTNDFLNLGAEAAPDDVIDFLPGDVFFGLDLDADNLATMKLFFEELRSRRVRTYFIVYDLLAVRHPEWWPVGMSNAIEKWLRTVSESDGLICISEATADDLKLWQGEHGIEYPGKIHFVHQGADIDNSAPSSGLPENYAEVMQSLQARPSFLMVGTLEPRKGHSSVLDAFELLWAEGVDLNLVIVGKKGWLVDELAERLASSQEKSNRLFWLEGVSDQYLAELYASTSCLLAASEGEGFGLPLIEAARHKLPILARDLAVFREVAGRHASYFGDDSDALRLAEAIKQWLQLFANGEHPRSDDMPYLTWEESTNAMLRVITDDNQN